MGDYDTGGLDVFQSTSGGDGLEPCSVCGRKFMPESLDRHLPICQKNAAKKRKVFDSTKQRVQGTDISLTKARQAQKEKEIPVSDKKTSWKAKHEDFINTIRAARGVTQAMKTGGPLPPPPPPTINPDYVQCPHCSRRFNETAAERHIPFCKEQQQRLGKKPNVDKNAKNKLTVRTQYKAPRPKLKGESSPSPSTSANRVRPSGSDNKTNNAATRPGSSRYSQSPVTGARSTQPNGSTGRKGGYDPYASAKDQMRNLQKTSTNSMATGMKKYHSHKYSDDDDDSLDSYYGAPMRTGKTQANYDEGKRMNSGPRQRGQQPKTKLTTTKGGSYDSIYATSKASPTGNVYNYTPSPPASGRPPSGSNIVRHRPFHQVMHESESGYHSNSDGELPRRKGSAARFCHDCGTKYPVDWAKFCCECGVRRMMVS